MNERETMILNADKMDFALCMCTIWRGWCRIYANKSNGDVWCDLYYDEDDRDTYDNTNIIELWAGNTLTLAEDLEKEARKEVVPWE